MSEHAVATHPATSAEQTAEHITVAAHDTAPTQPAPVHTHSAPAVHEANLTVLPAVLKNAEANLANYLGELASQKDANGQLKHPALAELTADKPDLTLSVVLSKNHTATEVKTHATEDVVLTFNGALAAANPALFGEKVKEVLTIIPAIHALGEHHQPQAEMHEGKLQLRIPNLDSAHYAHLVQSLAAGIVIEPVHAPAPVVVGEAVASIPSAPAVPAVPTAPASLDAAAPAHAAGCACASCAAAHAPAEAASHPATAVAAAAQASATGAAPAATVATPAANDGVVAEKSHAQYVA